MELDNLLPMVDKRFRDEFVRFVNTGEASAEFEEYLNGNEDAQQAVDRAFTSQVSAMEGLAQTLHEAKLAKQAAASPAAAAVTSGLGRLVARLPAGLTRKLF